MKQFDDILTLIMWNTVRTLLIKSK